jgi:hypothetical protein
MRRFAAADDRTGRATSAESRAGTILKVANEETDEGAIKCQRGIFCSATIDRAHVARRGKNPTIMTMPMARETQTTPPF